MGRWMEVLSRRPVNGAAALLDEYGDSVIGEIAPNPLLHAHRILPTEVRHHFPMLERITLKSSGYDNDAQQILLEPEDVVELDREFYYLRRLCRGEESLYLAGRPFDYYMTRWRGQNTPEEFESWVSEIERLIQIAIVAKAWIMLSV